MMLILFLLLTLLWKYPFAFILLMFVINLFLPATIDTAYGDLEAAEATCTEMQIMMEEDIASASSPP